MIHFLISDIRGSKSAALLLSKPFYFQNNQMGRVRNAVTSFFAWPMTRTENYGHNGLLSSFDMALILFRSTPHHYTIKLYISNDSTHCPANALSALFGPKNSIWTTKWWRPQTCNWVCFIFCCSHSDWWLMSLWNVAAIIEIGSFANHASRP